MPEVLKSGLDVVKTAINKLFFSIKHLTSSGHVTRNFVVILFSMLFALILYDVLIADKNAREMVRQIGREDFTYKFDQQSIYTKVLNFIDDDKGSESVSIWVVDPAAHKKRLIYRYTRMFGEDKSMYGQEFLLFTNDTNRDHYLKVQLKDGTECFVPVPETRYGNVMQKEGIGVVCLEPVPPNGEQFIGMVQVEYKTMPDEFIKDPDAVKRRIKKLGEKIITTGRK